MAGKNLSAGLLGELRKNSRRSIAEIARNVKAPTSTACLMEKKLRKDGIVERYTVMIEFEKLNAGIRIAGFAGNDKETRSFLQASPNVNNLQLLEENKLYFDAVFKRIGQFLAFKKKISGFGYIVSQLKAETAALKIS